MVECWPEKEQKIVELNEESKIYQRKAADYDKRLKDKQSNIERTGHYLWYRLKY